ncbi:MAG: cupredoxin domain-containing protein [Nanoarchaeota archaeon]
MSKYVFYIIGTILLILIAGTVLIKGNDNSGGNAVVGSSGGDVQKIVLGIKDYNYYPNTVKVQVNKPVSISLDSSVSGCYRSFTMRDFGINKYLKTPKDTVEFTPTKKGTYRFACSMGMGTGTLVVE